MNGSFEQVLDHIRARASSEADKGTRFERLMKRYFEVDPLYKDQFSEVRLWAEWGTSRPGFDGRDFGIDLVAKQRDAGYCAIQCKCYSRRTKILKKHLDSFIAASARDPFVARIVVDTGGAWGPSARRTIEGLRPRCQLIHFSDLAERSIDWPDLDRDAPESLSIRPGTYTLRPHQREAFDAVKAGLNRKSRGRLIMACGTGKTFTALRIAEAVAGIGRRVLYLVPSISLMQQSMREWAEQRKVPHRYIGICSDTRAGRTDEDAALEELEIPVTTDPKKIVGALKSVKANAMTVVFCTYQSLPLVARAQDRGAAAFDLVFCDEAHRTTGIDRPGDETSPFVLIHDAERIRATKRLYMTATPRLYTASAKKKAVKHEVEVFSMDDEAVYGPELHRLQFSQAIEQDLLSDYKVVILAMREEHANQALERHIRSASGKINLSDATKIVGCWRALTDPEHRHPKGGAVRGLRRAIAFTNTILSSKRLERHWDNLVVNAIELLPEADRAGALQCETHHIDGQHNALDRRRQIDWLKGSSAGACRILSNARCLSEGIDVPALDAVLFMSPRNSPVDIVQAVGRVMRKSDDKQYGYIILPVAVPEGMAPEAVLNDNNRFAAVWGVLRALRSHDDRFNAEINKLDLNRSNKGRIIFTETNGTGGGIEEQMPIPFPPLDFPPGAMYAKVVEKCGDRKYWETWAIDVADIFSRLVTRIEGLLEHPDNETLSDWFGAFLKELQASINDSIDRNSAVRMMAQHVLTQPVFDAVFEGYDFARGNPVARALDELRSVFGEFGLANETRDLRPFYESVRLRARGLDNSEARQRVLMELYEKFFATAMKKDAARLGIVYTPTEIVDFILASADHVLKEEFGRCLSDEGVHVLDPFTGTGIFLVRLIQSSFIRDADIARKYSKELHANEIVLLAYYIAAVHIEEAYRGRRGEGAAYEPFPGIVLTDTFNMSAEGSGFPKDWLPGNSRRADRQQDVSIEVVVANPPWSGGQRSSADDNPNVRYPKMNDRIAQTYVARSKGMRRGLYDTYKMAIRWASDRIDERGVVALVTNGSWIDGNVDSGVRACLAEEFSTVWVLNLRGNQRTQGERSRREGGKVFGQGSRAPVAITLLVRNPQADHAGCRILYRDIGDYLKREQKLSILRDARSINGMNGWQEITPDRHHDWIGQRDPAFQELYPMGSKEAKAKKSNEAIFRLFSNGYKTGRDAYLYNFSREQCAENSRNMIREYMRALRLLEEHPTYTLDEATKRFSSSTKWDQGLKRRLARRESIPFSFNRIWSLQYRPFTRQYGYVDRRVSWSKYQQNRIFPPLDSADSGVSPDGGGGGGGGNLAICVPGIGSTKPFSVLVVDSMPDLELVSKGQCFPRYRYAQGIGSSVSQASARTNPTLSWSPTECPISTSSSSANVFPGGSILGHGGIFDNSSRIVDELDRIDNITDTALVAFQHHYENDDITKDAIFDYVYGVLHAPAYRERFASDLAKSLPRIPMAPDFDAFAKAGRNLMDLHTGYETCSEYPLEVVVDGSPDTKELFRIGSKKMKWADVDRTELIINDHVRLKGIPPTAHGYVVNGRTPLEWFIDRYRVKTDRRSGIVNDPNKWFSDPRELVSAFKRISYVSVETVRIISGLPVPFPPDGN